MKRENISFLSNTKQSSQLQRFIPSNTIACNAAKHGGGGTEIIFLLPELKHDFSFGWGNFLSAPEHKSEQCSHAVIEIALCVTPTNCLPCLEPLSLCTVAQRECECGSVGWEVWRCKGLSDWPGKSSQQLHSATVCFLHQLQGSDLRTKPSKVQQRWANAYVLQKLLRQMKPCH